MQRSIPVISKFRQQYIISTKVLSQTMSVSAGNNTATVVVKHDAKKSTFFIQLDQKGENQLRIYQLSQFKIFKCS